MYIYSSPDVGARWCFDITQIVLLAPILSQRHLQSQSILLHCLLNQDVRTASPSTLLHNVFDFGDKVLPTVAPAKSGVNELGQQCNVQCVMPLDCKVEEGHIL